MSHLGDRLSALVDGELSHEERDRLLVHLAACEQCRAEATALRALKRRVAALGEMAVDPRLLRRLFAVAEPGGPVLERARAFPGTPAPRPALRMYPSAQAPASRGAQGRRRVRYIAVAAVSSAVIAVGGLSFIAGGTEGSPVPHITPPVEMFTVEHSVTTGEVPSLNPASTFLPTGQAGHGGP